MLGDFKNLVPAEYFPFVVDVWSMQVLLAEESVCIANGDR